MKRYEYSIFSILVNGVEAIAILFWDERKPGVVRRDFPSRPSFEAWKKLNFSKFGLDIQIPFDHAVAALTVARPVNGPGLIQMAAERSWLDEKAKLKVGDECTFHSGHHHVGNEARVTVTRVSMDHTHPSGHTLACWDVDNIMYEVAANWNPIDDTATLRWNARGRELTRAGIARKPIVKK